MTNNTRILALMYADFHGTAPFDSNLIYRIFREMSVQIQPKAPNLFCLTQIQ